jgi:hypothetical protein
MGRYMWSINGVKHADAQPLRFKMGERLHITFVNDAMMNHPTHLHGMWSDLETGDNNRLPRKHMVIVQPGSRISYRVNVDASGRLGLSLPPAVSHARYVSHRYRHLRGVNIMKKLIVAMIAAGLSTTAAASSNDDDPLLFKVMIDKFEAGFGDSSTPLEWDAAALRDQAGICARRDTLLRWLVKGDLRGGASSVLPASGQKQCYDNEGKCINCVGSGQDGEFQYGTLWPEPRFHVESETIYDRLTRLYWMRCADLTGEPATWSGALTAVDHLNGKQSGRRWRLPGCSGQAALFFC